MSILQNQPILIKGIVRYYPVIVQFKRLLPQYGDMGLFGTFTTIRYNGEVWEIMPS